MSDGKQLAELGVAGVVLILLGSALAPVTEYNIAEIGWAIVVVVGLAAVAIAVLSVLRVAQSLG